MNGKLDFCLLIILQVLCDSGSSTFLRGVCEEAGDSQGLER